VAMDGGILERVMVVELSVRDSKRNLFCVHVDFDAEECMRRVCNSGDDARRVHGKCLSSMAWWGVS
jgi:hypothetical protein